LFMIVGPLIKFKPVESDTDYPDSNLGQLGPNIDIEQVPVDAQVMTRLSGSHESRRKGCV